MIIKGFVFTLIVLTLGALATAPIIGSFVLIHRHTHSRTAFWLWLTGTMVYMAAAAPVLAAGLHESGLTTWVES